MGTTDTQPVMVVHSAPRTSAGISRDLEGFRFRVRLSHKSPRGMLLREAGSNVSF
jgi:hypothetical protein